MKKTLLAFTLFAAIASMARAQTNPNNITFTFNKQNNICIKARINQSDTLTLMYHSSSTGVTLTNEAVGKKLTLNLDKSSEVKTWGGTADARERLRWPT